MHIKLNGAEWAEINRLLDGGWGNKIPAVKVAKAAAFHRLPDSNGGTVSGVGLKAAKEAVEVLMAKRGMTDRDGNPVVAPDNPEGILVPFQPIKRVVVDMGSGEVTVDMEDLALKFSEGLTSLPITEVKRLFDLWQTIKDWEGRE
jgi:hypothetical protein